MKRFWAHFGFARRIRLLLVVCCLSAVLVAIVGTSIMAAISHDRMQHESFSSLTRVLAGNLAAAVAFRDATSAQLILNTLSEVPEARSAEVQQADGTVLTRHTKPTEPGFYSHRHAYDEAITVDGETVGRLHLSTDSGPALVALGLAHLGISALIACFAIGLALWLGRHLGSRLLAPINHLTSVASSISKHGDSSLRASPTGNPDVDVLVQALNQMLDRIQWQKRELHAARDRYAEQVVTLEHEIKQRRLIQEERIQIERKMQDAQRLESLGVLAGGVAHDFNNLLAAILGNTNLAQMRLPNESPVQRNLKQIETISTRAAELCRQMLAYAGRGPMALEPLSVDQLVRETAELLRVSIGHDCELSIEAAPGIPLVLGDGSQLRQIVLNFVVNASEAIGENHPGRILITVTSRSYATIDFAHARVGRELPAGDYVVISVADDGPGMSAEVLDRIFEPFFTTKFTGRGLGLAASLGIIRRHEGALFVESSVGVGSTFTVVLPASSADVSRTLAQHPSLAASWRGSGRILIVDDDESARQTEADFAEELGFIATVASSGDEALSYFNEGRGEFAAVVADYLMPRMDGVELAGILRQRHPHLPILLLSGFAESSAITDLPDHLQQNFLSKPFNFRTFATALRKAIETERLVE